jgi:hypothetical protein
MQLTKAAISVFLILFVLFTPVLEASAGFMDYLNLTCASPIIIPRGCAGVANMLVVWLPVGVIEVTPKACDFMTLGLLSDINPLANVCNSIPGLQGQATLNDNFNQNYMRNHVHIYTIPKSIVRAFALQAGAVCIGGVDELIDEVMDIVIGDLLSGIMTSDMVKKARQLSKGAAPVFISELVSPIWLNDMLSPDTKTTAPLFGAAMTQLSALSPAAGALACPALADNIAPFLGAATSNALYDPSFTCVGYWGFGYPRIGVTRHDDPKVASALAGVRFWHLFSVTFPILSQKFSYNHRLQLAYPAISPCFQPGSLFLPKFNITYSPDRKAIFIIWKQHTCCTV